MSLVLTRAELIRHGLDPCRGDRLARAGKAFRVAPSTFVLPGAGLSDRIVAALAHAGEDAIISGWAGCRLLGFPYADDLGAVPVLVPARRRRVTTAHIQVLPTTRVPRWQWCRGFRVAAPVRCLVDAARALHTLREVRALVLGAVSTIGVEAVAAELDAGARGGRALLRRALQDAQRGAASAPEAELADHAVSAALAGRLPRFLLNPDLILDGRFVGRPDGWFVGLGLGWEVDSREHHGGDDDLEETMARHDGFVTARLALLHVTPRRLRRQSPAYVRVLEAAALSRRPGQEPAALMVSPRGPLLPLSKIVRSSHGQSKLPRHESF